jgi:hypothetical protein
MKYVILKAKPHTRVKRGKFEHVKGWGSSAYSEQSAKEMMDWYNKHKVELTEARGKKRGWVPMKDRDYEMLRKLDREFIKKPGGN